MGKTIRRLWPFMRMDYKAAEEYLEKKAAQGLLLKEWAVYYHGLFSMATYEKAEPQKRKYCIDAIAADSEEAAEDYLQMAEDAGWKPIAAENGMVIFVSEENQKPVPMQTDWENEYRQIRKSFWRMELPLGIGTILILWVLPMIDAEPPILSVEAFRQDSAISLLLLPFIAVPSVLALRAGLFYLRSEIAIRTGKPMVRLGMKAARLWGTVVVVAGLAPSLSVLGIFLRLWIEDAMTEDVVGKAAYGMFFAGALGAFFISEFGKKIESKKRNYLIKGFLSIMFVGAAIVVLRGCSIG